MHYILRTILTVSLLWGIGFAWFIHDLGHLPTHSSLTTDGIVVLTGGRGRIEAGLNFLQQTKVQRLLISGVHEDYRLKNALNDHFSGLLSQIDLDFKATNTVENAEQAYLWAKKHDIHSLCLVTSDYHVRRALLVFKMKLPNVEIHPCTVSTTRSVFFMSEFVLLSHEYNKFLITLIKFQAYQFYNWFLR